MGRGMGIWNQNREGKKHPFCSIKGAHVGWRRTGSTLSHDHCGGTTAGRPRQVSFLGSSQSRYLLS